MNYMLSPFGQLGMAKALPVGPTNMLLKDIIAADPEWAKKAPVSPEAHRALCRIGRCSTAISRRAPTTGTG